MNTNSYCDNVTIGILVILFFVIPVDVVRANGDFGIAVESGKLRTVPVAGTQKLSE
jgi:hypothetical protein